MSLLKPVFPSDAFTCLLVLQGKLKVLNSQPHIQNDEFTLVFNYPTANDSQWAPIIMPDAGLHQLPTVSLRVTVKEQKLPHKVD